MPLSASGAQKNLRRHRLGRRAQRLAALAQLTAATTGILTPRPRMGRLGSAISPPGPATWSPWTPSMSAYVGKLKGVGPVWQLTAVDTATRTGIGALVAGDKSARDAARFVDHVAERLAGIGVEFTGVLTDKRPGVHRPSVHRRDGRRGLRHHRSRPGHLKRFAE